MKWIRLFEGFNTDEYYVKITFDEYLDLKSESSEGYDCLLTDKEKLWIEKNLPIECWQYSSNEDIVETSDVSRDIAIGASSVSTTGIQWVGRPALRCAGNGSGKFRFLYKLEDDYFVCILIEDEGMTYYKCDQFEGLLMLLKDKGII